MANLKQIDVHSKIRHIVNLMVYIMVLLIILSFVGACGSTITQQTGNDMEASSSGTDDTTVQTFTIDELSKFDGKDGNKAYIAIDGTVYDVTEIAQWGNRLHAGKFLAGKDYTEELKNAPHDIGKLADAIKIGTLVQP